MSKWILVTGGARRIGRAIALEMAAAGWDVILHYHKSRDAAQKTADEIKARGVKVNLAAADFSNKRDVENLIPALVKDTGPLLALVNNASLFEPDSHSPGGSQHKAINAEAPRVLSEAFRKQVPAGQTGAIVNLLDSCAPEINFTAYYQSKKSLRAYTLEMAHRFAPNVRVNGIAPGPVLPSARESQEHFKRQIASTLLQKEITLESIAMTVRFLIENPSITGEILHVDGGVRLKNTPLPLGARANG